nr:ribonuclease H-like domain-containing protein [Tanacetum cinerariifolium]
MDTCASSYLKSNVNNLSTVFNSCLYPYVRVGDGKTILVTYTGHSILPTLQRPLHLHNILVTPNIIKNLMSVRQFTWDNNCTIGFDAFGFSVKDFLTRHILLRCDSSGDLYPVTKPSSLPSALMSLSPSTWHQCLGHPEAYDSEINLGMEENMISNEFDVKLCLDHEMKDGNEKTGELSKFSKKYSRFYEGRHTNMTRIKQNTMGTHDDESGSSRSKRSRQYETVEEVMLPRVHHLLLLWEVCNQAAKSRYNTKLAQLLPRLIYLPCVVDWNVLNQTCYGKVIDEMLMIKLFVASTIEEIVTLEA